MESWFSKLTLAIKQNVEQAKCLAKNFISVYKSFIFFPEKIKIRYCAVPSKANIYCKLSLVREITNQFTVSKLD